MVRFKFHVVSLTGHEENTIGDHIDNYLLRSDDKEEPSIEITILFSMTSKCTFYVHCLIGGPSIKPVIVTSRGSAIVYFPGTFNRCCNTGGESHVDL